MTPCWFDGELAGIRVVRFIMVIKAIGVIKIIRVIRAIGLLCFLCLSGLLISLSPYGSEVMRRHVGFMLSSLRLGLLGLLALLITLTGLR